MIKEYQFYSDKFRFIFWLDRFIFEGKRVSCGIFLKPFFLDRLSWIPIFTADTSKHISGRLCSSSVGHRGKFGHEFVEFEFNSSGRLRYANNSNYKSDSVIRKEGMNKAQLFNMVSYC